MSSQYLNYVKLMVCAFCINKENNERQEAFHRFQKWFLRKGTYLAFTQSFCHLIHWYTKYDNKIPGFYAGYEIKSGTWK